ncbi:hypothetical protein DQ397_003096 [Pseudomonas sp. CK-NBRI-02]|uniref:hypothetical protein n=1 Tax=Pseudomonas TaxID=286 RepID=UPI0008A498DA|nr:MULTISPECIES: hypothetical protein [Pseudomonas]MDD2092468.1 hypothetical protein [Pseudomonas guariconensis]OFS71170.1 hypothetical protein HMPREF3173_18925 [Pseudomonas sp. HMSC08G10]TYO74841.1 hypothetical protein DQ397_003096 [Pseudomonas sp. CK-NBRI-02]
MYRLPVLVCSAVLVTLAGCASPGQPTGTKLTSKTPEAYAACVLPKWQAMAPLTTQKSISNGYRITAPSAVTSDDVLEIVKYHEGSRATFYKGSFLSTDKLRTAARECLD